MFLEKRNSGDFRMSGNGKLICEKILYASKDENEYFNNKKIFTKEDESSKSPYKK